MNVRPRYEHSWTVIHRPQPVPGLLIELHPHFVHAVSSNPVRKYIGPWRATRWDGRLRWMLGPESACTTPAAAPTGSAGTR